MRLLQILRRPLLLSLLLLFAHSVLPDCSLYAGERFVVRPMFSQSRPRTLSGLTEKQIQRPKVGLVLSGGGARGAAQIGVLKVLEQARIPVDFVAATSMGAIIGGLYAAGWTSAEIESLAIHTNWDYVLTLGEETERTDVFVDQRLAGERSFLTLRFDDFELVLPSAISTGQRLTTFLSTLSLQAPYHPSPSFDDLRIPFRSVATDLVTGRRVVLKDGSLAEALRASSTVPLLFNPIERGSQRLVDGGLVDNIPVDVAEEEGCDLIIVVNTTSGLRTMDQMQAPWEVADQIMGIMMQRVKEQHLRMADVVITPEVGDHLSSDFRGLDSLIELGEQATVRKVADIRRLYEAKKNQFSSAQAGFYSRELPPVVIRWQGHAPPDSLRRHIEAEATARPVTVQDVQEHVNLLIEDGSYAEVTAEVSEDSATAVILYRLTANPMVNGTQINGCRVIPPDELAGRLTGLIGSPFNTSATLDAVEEILRVYRRSGYSLARVDTARIDPETGILVISVNEGVIADIRVDGGVRTRDEFVLSQFPLEAGDVFELERARQGLNNINGTRLFEYVYLEIAFNGSRPGLLIRLKERPSQLLRFGLRFDNVRKLQGSLDIRDENFQGGGAELGLTVLGGGRNIDAMLEFKGRRLFGTELGYGITALAARWDFYRYDDAPPPGPNEWERIQVGEYRTLRYGGAVSVGSQIARLGNATVDYTWQKVETQNLENSADLEESFTLGMVRFATLLDNKDRYPFPTRGILLSMGLEIAAGALGGSVNYTAFRGVYEFYSPIVGQLVLHPKVTVGFADNTMPLAQQFHLGGRESFFGLHEDDSRGRQLFVVNLELRQRLPFEIFFETYIRLRYDLGTISTQPEALKFSTFRHALGMEAAFDTPIGPAVFAAGKAFFFSRNLPENPLQSGPLLLYMTIGYQIF